MNAERRDHRLNVLWRMRRQDEDTTRSAFESARSRVDSAETQVRRLRGLLDGQNAEARSALGRDTVAMARYRRSAADLTAALADASRYLAEARVDMEHRRGDLEQAMRQRKAADSLQRRSAADAAEARYRHETRTADDLHATRMAAGAAVRAAMGNSA